MSRWGTIALFCLGATLVALNLVGLVAPPAPPPDVNRPNAPAEQRRELLEDSLERRAGEPEVDYFKRLTHSVHYRMVPYSKVQEGGSDAPSLTDNWLLRLASLVSPGIRKYEFSDHRRALRRGYGLCSQYASIVFDVLREGGYHPRRVLWPEHTFVEVSARSGQPFVLDADLKVVTPHSLAQLREDPTPLRQPLVGVDPSLSNLNPSWTHEDVYAWMRSFLARPPGAILHERPYQTMSTVEPLLYVLKWVLPVLLMVAALALNLSLPGNTRPRVARLLPFESKTGSAQSRR